ncbi:MAG: O-antigen ligase family protein [Candidatus Sumerlaeaceae bacterium]|nr:O-antigen ligase family protein [Candidatus Sumerlaeaceae bacterium]
MTGEPPEIVPNRSSANTRRLVVLAIAGLALHALVYADRRALASFTQVAWAVMVITAILDRSMPLRARLRRIIPVYAGSLAICFATSAILGHPTEAVSQFLRYHLWAVWLTVLWLAASVWQIHANLWSRALVGLCVAHAFLCLLSAFAAAEPRLSMKLFGTDLGVYVGLFLIILRYWAVYTPRMLRCVAWGHTALISAAVIAMLVTVTVYATGDTAVRTGLEAQEWILSEPGDSGTTWRLLFPFQHHNRAGFFAMTAVFIVMAMALTIRSAARRGLAISLSAAAAVCLAFTLTRAAMAAAIAGLAVAAPMALAADRRLRWLLLLFLGLPLIWFGLPEAHKTRILQVTNPAAWVPGRATTTGARMVLWDRTLSLVARHPVTGVGYGYERFEQVFNKTYPDLVRTLGGTSHAHNQWLQAAAESGVPAALMLLVFTLARFAILIAAIRRSWPRASVLVVWLGLELAIQAYLMTNYTLRYSLGAYTYCIWAVGSAMALQALGRLARPDEPTVMPLSREVPAADALL